MLSRRIRSFLLVLVLLALTSQLVFADDGPIFRRSVSKTPDQETERANLNHMAFYVPAQSSDGTIGVPIEYFDTEGALVDTREYAKPLVAVYIDALPEESEEEEGIYSILSGGAGIGSHDAYAALSLDDGATWKRTNLSLSADLSSFTLADGTPFPGDAHNMTFAIAGDKVLVGWISRYCDGGSPLYTMVDEDVVALQEDFSLPDLYVRDIWGVAGSQKSVDYTLEGFPEVGEIPYSCVWSARGQLLPVEFDDGTSGYDIVWTKAERLTSGRRDANRLEMNGDSAAGFMMTWQEDPEGLRPGMGLGPGEGWSGAVVNQQTDLWYSFVSIENFTKVMSDDTEEATVIDIAAFEGDTTPKIAVPMAMPLRLTDNKMCKGTGSDPYCYVDFNTDEVDGVVNPYGNTDLPDDVDWDDSEAIKAAFVQSTASTLCTVVIPWTNPGGSTLDLCQAEDDRVLQGRVGASRPRVNVQPYNSLFITDVVTDTTWYDGGIVIMGAEESKALGEGTIEEGEEEVEPEDIGKNMWYYSFDLANPSFVMQGGMLNWPAKCNPNDAADSERCPDGVGEFYAPLTDDFGNLFYETEISRRFSHMSQAIHQFGETGISSVLIVKQGILNQGGPADIFLRLTKANTDLFEACDFNNDGVEDEQCLPEGYNPYAYGNLVCEDDPENPNDGWVYRTDLDQEANPRYVEGLCLSTGINVSGGSIVSCDNGTSGDACADAFPWDGGVSPFPKVTEWRQCDGESTLGGFTCEDNDLNDESWENPYDVAKGHRGYLDGDIVMMMYAWSPNWQANSVGNDHYNLYARRSFDGGETWTTTPSELGGLGEDGTDATACENYGAGADYTRVCFTYGAGEFEQSRNLSQLTGNKVTILDPRYTPTGGLKMLPITDLKGIGFTGYDDDVRDPSKFFIVYETGDNTTVAEGEAVPLDLFYSRATTYGDDYFLIEYGSSTEETTWGFDWLEHDREDLSGEAANTCNNGGTYYYVIWNQWKEDAEENVSDSDAIFRRVMFLPDEVTAAPTASILYVSAATVEQLAGDELTIVGSARDLDRVGDGIVAYKWTSDIDGVVGNEKTLNIPATALSRGRHTFTFTALDDEGYWSKGASVTVSVVEQIHRIMLPMVMRSK